jgi:acetyl-CoA C-acetyltransferase
VREAVIVSAVRTATGKFLGSLKGFTAPDLGALVIADAVRRAGIEPARVDECIMGNVVSAGVGQAPARQAALRAGLDNRVAALTINKVCGSGLKAVMLAAQAVGTGDADVVVAGGMESMSNTPHLLKRLRDGVRMGDATLIDAMVHDGLWDSFHDIHMGLTAEHVAEIFRVPRLDQDRFAAESHRRAALAQREGWFDAEILPVTVPQRAAEDVVFDCDESVRPDSTAETLGKLRPAFRKDGTVTAGNAPGVNDGAAALVVMADDVARTSGVAPLARIAGFATAGVEPKLLLMAPVQAVQKLLTRIGWTLADVDLVELNEAFAVQGVAVIRELGLDASRVNVHGGAVALGHPIGASGARVLTTLLFALRQRGLRRGIATLCLGGGNAVALAVELV